jgi:hypothetical protein
VAAMNYTHGTLFRSRQKILQVACQKVTDVVIKVIAQWTSERSDNASGGPCLPRRFGFDPSVFYEGDGAICPIAQLKAIL